MADLLKFNHHDIGAEILSILTKGMYADPKDTLREYVQNGVDANAKNINIRIRQNNIVIHDYGHGMDKGIMRKAVRLGISDKNPKRSVGFMGIGLYSSFHLCDKLTIISKTEGNKPNKLEFKFKEMRDHLEAQKESRILGENVQDQITLLSLLQDFILLSEMEESEFPTVGTRVEMSGVEGAFFNSLSQFEEVSEYLEKAVPLPFSPDFSKGKEIQDRISAVCEKYNAEFRLVNLELQINDQKSQLFRPYKDSDFKPIPMPPKFVELDSAEGFLGIAWGVLNKANEVIKNEKVRGFLIKKHGFTIGTRNNLLSTFGAKFFNRYVGEFIIVHPKALPNGARSDFEYSTLRSILFANIEKAAEDFNEYANKHQEIEKAEIELNKLIDLYRITKSSMPSVSESTEKLLEAYRTLFKAHGDFNRRIKASWKIRDEKKEDAQNTLRLVKELIDEILALIEHKAKSKKKTYKNRGQITEELQEAPNSDEYSEPELKSLTEVIDLIGIPYNQEMRQILELFDEQLIKPQSKNDSDYQQLLLKIKSDIEDLFTESDEEQ